jgi:hypothetical protein
MFLSFPLIFQRFFLHIVVMAFKPSSNCSIFGVSYLSRFEVLMSCNKQEVKFSIFNLKVVFKSIPIVNI